MALADVSSSDVTAAIREFDELGRDAFLEKYGMGKSRSYILHYQGNEYDSKAILAAAHGHHPGYEPLGAAQFSGGDHGAARLA
jgi:5-methylcytosine-specific restriction enzyme A